VKAIFRETFAKRTKFQRFQDFSKAKDFKDVFQDISKIS